MNLRVGRRSLKELRVNRRSSRIIWRSSSLDVFIPLHAPGCSEQTKSCRKPIGPRRSSWRRRIGKGIAGQRRAKSADDVADERLQLNKTGVQRMNMSRTEQNDINRTQAMPERKKTEIVGAAVAVAVELKDKVEEEEEKKEVEGKQEAAERKETKAEAQVIQGRGLSQEKDDDDTDEPSAKKGTEATNQPKKDSHSSFPSMCLPTTVETEVTPGVWS
jgi:hypothetical protein